MPSKRKFGTVGSSLRTNSQKAANERLLAGRLNRMAGKMSGKISPRSSGPMSSSEKQRILKKHGPAIKKFFEGLDKTLESMRKRRLQKQI